MTTERLSAMRVFATVAHLGSFVGAARQLHLSTTVVSRQIAELENALGIRLLQRTTRSLRLTEAGTIYLDGCNEVLDRVHELETAVGAVSKEPRGRLRVATPSCMIPISRAMIEYRRTYPHVSLEIIALNRAVDIVDEQFDVWIHIFGPIPANHIAKPLAALNLTVCASPAYLARHGTPLHPQDLEAHHCLTTNLTAESNPWRFERKENVETIKLERSFVSNDAELIRQLALAGEGILRMPEVYIVDDIRAGRLQPLLQDWSTQAALKVSAVYPTAQHVPTKVRLLLDLLAASWK